MGISKKYRTKGKVLDIFCLCSVLLLALLIRLYRLGTFDFWHDEAHNLLISQDLSGALFEGQFIANHPPLPYIFLYLWQRVGMGGDEGTIRGLPVLFGVLGILAVWWLAKELFGSRVALISAFLLAISPFHTLHSQDLKEYIYLPFFATTMAVFFYRAACDNKKINWFLYGIFAGICCYTEAFVAPLLVAINLWFLCQYPRNRLQIKGWFLSNVLGAFLFLPWLGMMLGRVHRYLITAEHWWVPWPDLWSIIFYFKTISFGYTAQKIFFYPAFMVFFICGVAGTITAIQRNRKGGFLLLFWAVIPVAIVFILSYIGQSIFLIRAMLPYSIAVYILVAVGIDSVPWPRLRGILMIIITLLSGVGLYEYYGRNYSPMQHPHRPGIHPPRDYSHAAKHILDNLHDGDRVIHSSQATWLPFYWYGFSEYPQYVAGNSDSFNKIIISSNPINTTYEDRLRLWPKMVETIVQDAPRIWYVFSEWERAFLPGNSMLLYYWMDSRFTEVEHSYFNGIEVFCYEVPEKNEEPVIIERDFDDGISSQLKYACKDQYYSKSIPDAGLLPRSAKHEQNNILLQFDDITDELNRENKIGFSLKNRREQDRDFLLLILSSSILLPFTSFSRNIPVESSWNYLPYWNDKPPPITYPLGTLSGEFTCTVDKATLNTFFSAGIYDTYVYAFFPWNDVELRRAAITVTAEKTILMQDSMQARKPFLKWQWLQGAPLTLEKGKVVTLEVTGRGFTDNDAAYANLGYIAFLEKKSFPSSVNPDWKPFLQDEVHIGAGEIYHWEQVTDTSNTRVDIWAFEKGDLGRVYHIYRLFDPEEE